MGVPYAEVIGDPIAQSKSPIIHNFWLKTLGIEGEYRATKVTASELPAYFAERRADPDWRGCNVTMPHKNATAALTDGLFPEAKAAGAVNTVFRYEDKLIGTNTDLRGFAEPFRTEYHDRGPALIIGTGAAARTAFVALAALNFDPVQVTGRNAARAQALLDGLGQTMVAHPIEEPLPKVILLVNASASGMGSRESLEIDLAPLPPSAIVYDIVYDPLETKLLAQARRRGLRTIDGLTMLIGQAAAAFVYIFGQEEPPRDRDAELREMLTS
jgi:shikimate dehydrogenase